MRKLEQLGGVRVYHAETGKTILVPITVFNNKRQMAQLGYTEIRKEEKPQAPPMAIDLDKETPKVEKPKEKKKVKTLSKEELKNIAKDGN